MRRFKRLRRQTRAQKEKPFSREETDSEKSAQHQQVLSLLKRMKKMRLNVRLVGLRRQKPSVFARKKRQLPQRPRLSAKLRKKLSSAESPLKKRSADLRRKLSQQTKPRNSDSRRRQRQLQLRRRDLTRRPRKQQLKRKG